MSDSAILNEIALNERKITHPQWGSFVIKRPTNKISGQIETLKTRQRNRDLQTKDRVLDPETGEYRMVPAFLTTRLKKNLLKEQGEWSTKDEEDLNAAEKEYMRVCKELSDVGFTGVDDLFEGAEEIRQELENKILGHSKEKKLLADLKGLFNEGEKQDPKVYQKVRDTLQRELKDHEADVLLSELDILNQQYQLYYEGIDAQARLMGLRFREITLFNDTIEVRAENVQRIALIFYCTYDEDGESKVWESIDECENDHEDKLGWLLGEIEKLRRLQAGESEEDLKRKERFNFLFPSSGTVKQSEDLQDQPESKEDGEQSEKTQETSTDPSENETTT
jgi:hypothetical protein